MLKGESLKEFYHRHNTIVSPGINTTQGHFNVYTRADYCSRAVPYNRRDFYKISLIIGTGTLSYPDKAIEIDQPALLFSNPLIPYSWEAKSIQQEGYFCLFTENFFVMDGRLTSLQELPMFKIGGNPIFFLTDEQIATTRDLYLKMLQEIQLDYVYKYDLLRNYTSLLIHEALKMQPADAFFMHHNASARITNLFLELLERQFPIDSPRHILLLKTAADYAKHLSVHVNHLNRSVKEITGKTTTEQISDRVVKEAKALLLHTNWNVSEIAYSLGFEYPSYFNNFFRKQTGQTPSAFRD
jgi:AraC family transcriptional regulator, transcriptional activator of pobA